jgi:hypothetical protein
VAALGTPKGPVVLPVGQISDVWTDDGRTTNFFCGIVRSLEGGSDRHLMFVGGWVGGGGWTTRGAD